MENRNLIIQDLFEYDKNIRYVAIRWEDEIIKQQRDNICNSSSSDSDFYEEQIVNPCILLLGKQRGDIDCGGLRHVIIAYGNFFQVIRSLKKGHISICVENVKNITEAADSILCYIGDKYKQFF
ncbi:MAG TPA: hypothetical protein PKA19_09445 [Bacillota bacterium]|nr:hypothetical protein [Bacillota bacterium]